jgi:signal transduction histidine kinase
MRYKARIIKTAKYPVKLPKIFDLTIEELDLNTDIDLDVSKVSFEISDKIKNRNFLLDKNLITQAFEAIGLNALTFNDSTEKELKVKAFIRNKNLIFDFEDNGIGIKKEDFNKIFEPLVSGNGNYLCKDCAIETCVDCRHKIFADGVGLTYAKGIIEAHNGEIFVLKSKPKHTIIRVVIPV